MFNAKTIQLVMFNKSALIEEARLGGGALLLATHGNVRRSQEKYL